MKKKVVILGSTGSIGLSTVDVVESLPDHFHVVGLSAHGNEKLLLEQASRLGVKNIALSGRNPADPRIQFSGEEGLLRMIEDTEADIVVNGIAGAPGFLPSLKSLETGKHLALANKETLVMAGELVKNTAARKSLSLLPVDSEHSAIFQMFHKFGSENIENVVLTASGGAFRDLPKEKLENVTPEDALRHPTWSMGKKITIDSASLANKGLEVIEAHHLFDMGPDNIRVLVHPQSYVHSFIETKEGSLYAQVGKPDMRIPILNALSYPRVIPYPPGKFSLSGMSLSFSEPDFEKYPMLPLAYQTLRSGGAHPLVYNAANEVAVEAFIDGRISFPGIAELTARTLGAKNWPSRLVSVDEVLHTDSDARWTARGLISLIRGARQ
jgi:1-deoxy-D-xylulose-5-phosphate reductoisomerase